MQPRASPLFTQYAVVLKERGFVFLHLCKKSCGPVPVSYLPSCYFKCRSLLYITREQPFPIVASVLLPTFFFFLEMLLILAWWCHRKEVVFRKIFVPVRKKSPMTGLYSL